MALLVLDMQNDFLTPKGVYRRLGGLDVTQVSAIIPNVKTAMEKAKSAGVPVIGTKFTVLTGLKGEAIGLGHLEKLRPFLKQEGFRQGSEGHNFVAELPKPDYEVLKTRFSAFYASPLEAILKSLGVKTVVMTGVATYGAVEATAREAIVRDYEIVTLSDCCASFSPMLQESALTNLAAMGQVTTVDKFGFEN
jgi:nicotinamidase-related amidase